jgi:hypothetical protein
MLNVGLVGWVDVHVVFTGAGHVQVLVTSLGVHTEMEFRVLSGRFFSVVGVLEVKISRDVILVRSRLVDVLVIDLTLAGSNCNCLAYVSQMVGVVFIGSDRLLHKRSALLVKALSWLGLGWFDDKSWCVVKQGALLFVSTGAGNLFVFNDFFKCTT